MSSTRTGPNPRCASYGELVRDVYAALRRKVFDGVDGDPTLAAQWVDEPHTVDVQPARPASTVMLLREDSRGLEVFVIRRASTMAFVPTAVVFPGGRVDERDAETMPWAGPPPAEWALRLATDERTARQLLAAAARELFEEAGVLLAGPDANSLVSASASRHWSDERTALENHELSFTDFLNEHDLVLRSDLFTYRSRWVTPPPEPRRYDTFFFTAALPPGQDAISHTREADLAGWVRPDWLLAEGEAGRQLVVFPTQRNLLGLLDDGTVPAATAPHDVIPVMMHSFRRPSGELAMFPGPPDF
jgi:8-oxo-dGTP pyrophosphatase MutT (NUDIX family)